MAIRQPSDRLETISFRSFPRPSFARHSGLREGGKRESRFFFSDSGFPISHRKSGDMSGMTAVPGSGMTLIELLIAAAIAGLLLAVVLAVYSSILNTVALQNRWRDRIMPVAGALDFIVRDLACAMVPFGDTNRPFIAASSEKPEDIFKMSFYSAFPTRSARSDSFRSLRAKASGRGEASERAGSSNDWRGYSAGRVSYTWRNGGVAGKPVLIRECEPFRVPSRNSQSSGREQWRGIKKLQIDFFDGSSWVNQWGEGKNTNDLPQAARIKLVAGQNDQREFSTEVFINAGRQIVPEKSK